MCYNCTVESSYYFRSTSVGTNSTGILEENKGFRRNSCNNSTCLPCNAMPPIINPKVVQNLTSKFCKVSEEELHGKMSKKPKKKDQGDMAEVSKAMESNKPNDSS